jgi:hypothetical protein
VPDVPQLNVAAFAAGSGLIKESATAPMRDAVKAFFSKKNFFDCNFIIS